MKLIDLAVGEFGIIEDDLGWANGYPVYRKSEEEFIIVDTDEHLLYSSSRGNFEASEMNYIPLRFYTT